MKTKKEQAQNKRDVIDRDLWNNQPNIVIGVGVAILVLLGIYIKLLDKYQ